MVPSCFDWVGSSRCNCVLLTEGNICCKGEKVNQQVQPLQVTTSLIRGSMTWNLPSSMQLAPGDTIPITVTITNPTDELRLYFLVWALIRNGEIISEGLVELEDIEEWFIDGGESHEISFELSPEASDCYLNVLLLAGITELEEEEEEIEEIIDSLTTYLYSTAAPAPLQVTAQTFQVVMGVIMAVWMGAWVLSQVVRVVKGEEVEKPPLVLK